MTMKLHQDFVNNLDSLSTGARDLRRMLSDLGCETNLAKWKFQRPGFFGKHIAQEPFGKLPNCITDEDVINFCDKLVFVVNSPSEDELDDIIRTDVNNYYNQNDTESEFLRISKDVLDWFKSIKDKNKQWLSSRDWKRILLGGITKQSKDYRDKLMEEIGFNQNAIENMATKLKQDRNSTEKVVYISTLSPRWTAAKIVSAIETWPENKTPSESSYWITSYDSFLDKEERKLWKNRLELIKDSRHLLLVVADNKSLNFDSQNVDNLFSDDPAWKNKIIVLVHGEGNKDEFQFGDLKEDSTQNILSKPIIFQGSKTTISNLIPYSEVNKVIDFFSIKELMDDKTESISIPSINMSSFEKSLYIPRKLTQPFDKNCLGALAKELKCTTEKLQSECTVDSKGKIRWSVNDERKSLIWKEMKMILERNKLADDIPPSVIISENELINDDDTRFKVIITGVAGTGKSSILSHFYEELKRKKPDYWIINISLRSHLDALQKLDDVNQTSAIDFIANLSVVGVDHSPFAQSLLRHRLETGDRIILMLDGFDEVDTKCQDQVIKLINSLNENTSLFITTRPHMADKLQVALSQLAYSLVKFEEADQINYVTSIWKTNLKNQSNNNDEEEIRKFATKLIDRISATLNDEERKFIGIPLQCRILAECFQSKIQAIIQDHSSTSRLSLFSQFEDYQQFDLASLYKTLIDTKREGKFKFNADNHLVNSWALIAKKQLECHLTKLAIKTIFQDEKLVNILWPIDSRYQSEKDCEENEKNLDKLGVDLGLLLHQNQENMNNTIMRENGAQFLHRTYAEYLVADYIYQGFQFDEKEYNKLLENKDARQLIAWDVFAGHKYDGVQVFLNSMFKKWKVDYANGDRQNRNGNIVRSFPKHLQEFAHLFSDAKGSLFCLLAREHSFVNLERRENTNIFKFILDCLDETFTTPKVREVITRDVIKRCVSHIILQLESHMFQRLLAYFDDANDVEWNKMFISLCNIEEHYWRTVNWDRELPQKNINIFLDFIEKHHERLKKQLEESHEDSKKAIRNMFKFLIQNANIRLTTFLKEILSLNVFNDLFLLLTILKDAIERHYPTRGKHGKILETLNFLRDKEFQPITYEISCLVLRHEPEAFQEFYKQHRQPTEAEFADDFVDSDLFGMTRLHRAVLYGDIKTVKQILEKLPEKVSLSSLHKSPEKLLFHDSLIPLYVAFACRNEEICQMMLKHLTRLPTEELQFIYTNKNGCLNLWTNHAIRYRKELMFQTILESVKTHLGYEVLVDLLKSTKPLYQQEDFEYHGPGIFSASQNCWLFEIITSVFVEDDETNGYKQLNEFIFSDEYYLELALKYGETNTFQNKIAKEEFDNWIKRLLEKESVNTFRLLSSRRFLTGLEEMQCSRLVDIVTTINEEKLTSYWADCINRNSYWAVNFMKYVSEIFNENENVVNKLLFHEDDKGVVLIRAILEYEQNDVDEILAQLSEETKKEFRRHWSGPDRL